MERKNYIVAIDLGSTNVTLAVAEQTPDGMLDVVHVGQKATDGVKAGLIENIEQVDKAIRDVVTAAEKKLGFKIEEAYAGISGEFVRCARHTDHVFVYDPNNGVSSKDLEALFDRMRNVQAPDDEQIMERVPQNYKVDDSREVDNPQGSFCKKLSSTFNFILCQKTPIQRLEMALKRTGIKALKVMPNSMVNTEAVLSDDEKEEGVAVVNIGGGLTDVTVYYHNRIRYVASIPMGASAINRDITTMSVPEKYVEKLKRKYGSAVADLTPDDILIRVNGRTSREAKDILLRNLATVIEARATDIAEFVYQEIQDSKYYDRLAYGIVLTGGSAKLKDIDKLFNRVTNMEVRIAVPDTTFSQQGQKALNDPSYATIAGILIEGAKIGASSVMVDLPEPEVKVEEKPAPKPQQPVPPQQPAQPVASQPQQPVAPKPQQTPVMEQPKQEAEKVEESQPEKMPKSQPTQPVADEPQQVAQEQEKSATEVAKPVQTEENEEEEIQTKKKSRFTTVIKNMLTSFSDKLNGSFQEGDEEI